MEYLEVETIPEIKCLATLWNVKGNSRSIINPTKDFREELLFLKKSILVSEYKLILRESYQLFGDNQGGRLKFLESEKEKAFADFGETLNKFRGIVFSSTYDERIADILELQFKIDALSCAIRSCKRYIKGELDSDQNELERLLHEADRY